MGLTKPVDVDSLLKSGKAPPPLPPSNPRAVELETAILKQFDALHSLDFFPKKKVELRLLQDEFDNLEKTRDDVGYIDGLICFSPSSVSKCPRELFFKGKRAPKDTQTAFPFQRRQMRNGTAVHRATQRDLIYSELLLPDPAFTVARTPDGKYAWEQNIATIKTITHNGVTFQLYGMMDGQLIYQPDICKVGFEFKTKSTTIASVGNFKMREAMPSHKFQCTAYSLIFGIDEFLLVYESLAKDGWTKGADAKPDMRAFYIKVTEADRERLLDFLADTARKFYAGELPDADREKCLFCVYKTQCVGVA
jgi:hypothetical protein